MYLVSNKFNPRPVKQVHFAIYSFTIILLLILSTAILPRFSSAETEKPDIEIGIDEHLGEMIPMNVPLSDENGDPITLAKIANGKPFILSLVYYECPSICSPLLTDLGKVMDQITMRPGEDFTIVTISFDPNETFFLAANKKKNYFAALHRKIPESSWRFLTGTKANITKITSAAGFKYKKVDDQWVHSGAILAVSPQGKIARYLYGIEYLPFDVKMALTEASQGRTGPTINKLLLYCFNYDPEGRQYVFNILAVVGTVSLIVGISFLGFLIYTTKKYRTPDGSDS